MKYFNKRIFYVYFFIYLKRSINAMATILIQFVIYINNVNYSFSFK
jgi:hypothetical protein